MVHHLWGDEGVDWGGINNAAYYISHYLRKYGRITAHGKEKYGTVRIEFLYFGHSLHNLIWPGCIYLQWWGPGKGLFLWLDVNVWCKFIEITRLSKLWSRYQLWVYRRAYANAIKQWPHLYFEILTDAEHELLGLDPADFGWETFK